MLDYVQLVSSGLAATYDTLIVDAIQWFEQYPTTKQVRHTQQRTAGIMPQNGTLSG